MLEYQTNSVEVKLFAVQCDFRMLQYTCIARDLISEMTNSEQREIHNNLFCLEN